MQVPTAAVGSTPVPSTGGKTSRITPVTKPSGVDPLVLLQERENRLLDYSFFSFFVHPSSGALTISSLEADLCETFIKTKY